MEMLSAFTAVLHVHNLSKPEHFLAVLESSQVFSKQEMQQAAKQVKGKRWVVENSRTNQNFFFQAFHWYQEIAGFNWHGEANRTWFEDLQIDK